ncbi:uncharacterized protein TNCV_1939561 [Trichonephila clavipes]|nr:uncharacterized protein TNCV_1939561 [Trichonephila clavipes]
MVKIAYANPLNKAKCVWNRIPCFQNFVTVQANVEKSYFRSSVVYTVSILSDDQRTDQDTFVDTFVQLVYESDTLKDLFDLSETPAIGYSHHAYKTSKFSPEKKWLLCTPTRLLATHTSRNPDSEQYQRSRHSVRQHLRENRHEYVVEGDPTSKYRWGNGFIQFLMSIDNLTVEKGWVVPFFTKAIGLCWLLRHLLRGYLKIAAQKLSDSRDSN